MSTTVDALAAGSWPADRLGDARRRLQAAVRTGRELASAEGASGELLKLLPDLGPVCSGFARFLATRADLVPAGLRAALSTVGDRVTAAPFDEVRLVAAESWRAGVDDVCFSIDPEPVRVRFPTQSHRAWLSPTDAVIVTCVPRSFAEAVTEQLPALSDLASAFVPVLGRPAFDRLAADYRGLLERRLDLGADVAAGDALVADARRFPALRAVRPHPGLSGPRVAVWDEVAAVPADAPGADHVEDGAAVCRAWLRQALLGRTFPEEADVDDFVVAGRRQIAIGGRLFARLPAGQQVELQGYLVAVAAGDPDLAMRYLRRLLRPGPSADAEGMERRLRHAWSVDADAAGGSELLAQVLLHWRIAVDHGFEPLSGLTSFFRGGLSAVAAAAARGAEGDVFRDALAALQVRLVAAQVEAATGVSPTSARSPREAIWRVITTFATGPIASDRTPAAAGAPLPLFGALLLALVAIAIAMPRLVGGGAAWAEPMGAAFFAATAGTLLHLMTRKPRR